MMGYNKSNTSPLLKRFLVRADDLVTAVQKKPQPAAAIYGGRAKASG
jgi:hypothetical protein